MGLGGSTTSRLQIQKVEQISQKQSVGIDLPRAFQQSAQQALALIEGLVEEGQLT